MNRAHRKPRGTEVPGVGTLGERAAKSACLLYDGEVRGLLSPVLGASLLAWPLMAVAEPTGETFSDQANLTFGAALAADGSRLAVGVPGSDMFAFDGGAVHVYTLADGQWVLRQRVTPEADEAHQTIGVSVAIDGDMLLVGGASPLPDGGSLAIVVVFEAGDGVFAESARWVLDERASLRYGGRPSLAIDGDTLAFGASLETPTPAASGGRIRVQRREAGGWVEQADIVAAPGDSFGDGLVLRGDWLFALADDGGRVAIWRRDGATWQKQPDLQAPPGAFTWFEGLAADDDVLVVGEGGAARLHLYDATADGWAHHETHSFAGGDILQTYPWRPVVAQGRIAYATRRATETEEVDEVHLLRREGDTWIADGVISQAVPDRRDQEAFGVTLALAGERVLVGAPEYGDFRGERAGRVHAFARDGAEWRERQILDGDDALAEVGCGCRGGAGPGWLALPWLLLVRRRRQA